MEGFRLHTQCFLVACEFCYWKPVIIWKCSCCMWILLLKTSDNLKMFLLHVNFLLKTVIIWKCSCMFLFTSSTKAGNWNNYSAQYCSRWTSLGLGLLRSWNWNNCSAQYCKAYTSLDLFFLTPFYPFFSQESRLPLVWNFFTHTQYQDTASRYVAKSIPEKSTGIFAFLWKTSKTYPISWPS
jgi:hypothetical protein